MSWYLSSPLTSVSVASRSVSVERFCGGPGHHHHSFKWFFPPSVKLSLTRHSGGKTLRALSGPADLGGRFATCDKLTKKRKEESFAEPAERWFGLKVKGAADDVAVEFIEDDPEPKIGIEPGSPFLNGGDFCGETRLLRLLRGDREKHHQISVGSWEPYANGDRPILAALSLTLAGFSRPEMLVWTAPERHRNVPE